MNKITLLLLLLSCSTLYAQNITIDGYAFESGNRGFLNRTQVVIYNSDKSTQLAEVFSSNDGHFVCTVPEQDSYVLVANKSMFLEKEQTINGADKNDSGKIFLKLEMRRAPGYIFEITLANERDDENIVVDAIKGADIEVYNNTKNKMELVLEDHPNPDFNVNLLKGNYYTIMIRKEGYLTKRMEAHVDIDGCILCFEGIGEVRPGVTDNLTEGNEMGVLLANVEMESVALGKEFRLDNLYYSYGKADITPQAAAELDKLIVILKDNPNLRVELGSHTDSRGTEDKNFALSRKRAKAAVDYILEKTDISPSSLSSRGYGESKLVNDCNSSADCTEEQHAINRRTEIKVLGIDPNIAVKSLAERKKEEDMERLILDLMNQEQIKVPEKEVPPTDAPVKIPDVKKEGQGSIEQSSESDMAPMYNSNSTTSNVVVEAAIETVRTSEPMQQVGNHVVVENPTIEPRVEEKEIKRINKPENTSSQTTSSNVVQVIAASSANANDPNMDIIIDEEKAYRLSNGEGASNEEMKFEKIINPSDIPNSKTAPVTKNTTTTAVNNISIPVNSSSLSSEYVSIVLHFSSKPLNQSHMIYQKNRDLKEYKTTTGNYIYYIGKFQEEKDAKNYMQAQAQAAADYPNAYLVKFKDGELLK